MSNALPKVPVKNILFDPCFRESKLHLFQHLHSLGLSWHSSRKTGEILRVMDRGTSSISDILQYMFFNILPTILDIILGN